MWNDKFAEFLLSAVMISFAVICICCALVALLGVGMMIAGAF
jgi:hypothetical protein